MELYSVYEKYGSEEFPIGDFKSILEAYGSGFLKYLDGCSENLYDESREEFYATELGGWFSPDADEDIWESDFCIMLPSIEEIKTSIEKTGRFEFNDSDGNLLIVIEKYLTE